MQNGPRLPLFVAASTIHITPVTLSRIPLIWFRRSYSLNALDRLVAHPLGAFAALSLAALLEVYGDSFFQVSFFRSTGFGRVVAFFSGAAVLALYGSVVNVPRWDFGKLLGVYVALFFVMAQVVAKLRFGQSPTPPIYAGGSLIVAGGLLIAFWKG
jgi:small multidrug resistance family-3 protein